MVARNFLIIHSSMNLTTVPNHQKDKIAYVPLNLFADYIYIADLNTRLHVGWKTKPNLNFKPKFQTKA